jgi:2-desacetyl-2-hydroxyethyl bacteriochlorophyllide A dehydrogenase
MSDGMRAALFSGMSVELVDRPIPLPGVGEVQFKVTSAGICGSDLQFYRGDREWNRGLQIEDGHELSGVVTAVGPAVDGLEVGQRVAIEPEHLVGCGKCRWCRSGDTHLCPVRGKVDGTEHRSHGFSQYDVCVAENVYALPDNVSNDAASLLDCYACAVHAIRRAPVAPGATVVIIGTGAIGVTLGQVVRARGAGRVIIVGRSRASVDRAVAVGAGDVGYAASDGPVERILEETGGQGADVVFETVGGAAGTVAEAVALARRGGTIGILGVLTGPPDFPVLPAFQKELQIVWSNSYSRWEGVSEFKIALDLLASGSVMAEALITHHFDLEHIHEAFDTAGGGTSGALKVLVHP